MPSNESAAPLLHSGAVRNEKVLMPTTSVASNGLQCVVQTDKSRDVPLSESLDATVKLKGTTPVESMKSKMLEIKGNNGCFSPEEANHVTIDENHIKSPVHKRDNVELHSETPNKSKQRNTKQNLDGLLDQNLLMQSKVATTGSDLSPFSGISSVGTYESTGYAPLPSTVSCPIRTLLDPPINIQGSTIGSAIECNSDSPSQTLEIESIGSDTDQSGLTPIPLTDSPDSQTKERNNTIVSNYLFTDKSWSREYNKPNHQQEPVPYYSQNPSFRFPWEDRIQYHYDGYHATSCNYGSAHRYQSSFYGHTFQEYDVVDGYKLSRTTDSGVARTSTRRNNSSSSISHQVSERKVFLKPMNIVSESSPGQQTNSPHRQVNTNPRVVLRSVRKAFLHLKYILPFLRSGNDICSVSISSCHSTIRHYRSPTDTKDDTAESEVSNTSLKSAKRRVECAIRYFGGNPIPNDTHKGSKPQSSQPIFRFQTTAQYKRDYAEKLKGRFCLNGSRPSWDLEENPPIHIANKSAGPSENTRTSSDQIPTFDPQTVIKVQTNPNDPSSDCSDSSRDTETRSKYCSSFDESEPSEPAVVNVSNKASASNKKCNSKLKYHCKRCGQPKQNHRCPFEERLQRSIGVMVHTAINAYMAEEPGFLAPALTEMNNFVSYDEYPVDFNQESPPLIPFERTARIQNTNYTGPTTVTPEQRMRLMGGSIPCGFQVNKQPSQNAACFVKIGPTSTMTDTLSHGNGYTSKFTNSGGAKYREDRRDQNMLSGKRTLSQYLMEKTDHETRPSALASGSTVTTKFEFMPPPGIDNSSDARQKFSFANSVAIRPEQYRSVTMEHDTDNPEAYQYPSIPLPRCERQRLSDTLFFIISLCVPDLQHECVQILQDIRKKSSTENAGTEWDLAVAELLTQVIVGVYCTDDDENLDGLSNYLKWLGIAC